jgi:GrpB-like predicted nucleotidyltransferase (UPF0157 family)
VGVLKNADGGTETMITIIEYQPAWPGKFAALGKILRDVLGDLAVRIDHIGSTAVPGLAAKDIIDIQVTAARLEVPVEAALNRAGYRRLEHITCDHSPPGGSQNEDDWRKWMFRADPENAPVNLHVRLVGCANQRYPLLFRDYLRTHDAVAQAYRQVKIEISKRHPNDADAYYDIKDPVCDIIMGGAEAWAKQTGWQPPVTDA